MSDEMRLIQNNMQVIEELHHKIMALEMKHRHLDKRMDGWVSQIIKYKEDIDDKIWDDKQEIDELKSYIVSMRKIQQSQDTQHAELESVLKELSAKDDSGAKDFESQKNQIPEDIKPLYLKAFSPPEVFELG